MFFLLFLLIFEDADYNPHNRRYIKPKQNNFDQNKSNLDQDNNGSNQIKSLKNSDKQFPHSHINSKGKLVCDEGYLTDKAGINERGCWSCPKKCDINMVCAYPGQCVVPTPVITKVYDDFELNIVTVHFSVNATYFRPLNAYCRLDGNEQTAVKVSPLEISCSMTKQDYNTIEIAFDYSHWSQPSIKVDIDLTTYNIILIVMCCVVFVIILACLCKCFLRRKGPRLPAYKEVREIPRNEFVPSGFNSKKDVVF